MYTVPNAQAIALSTSERMPIAAVLPPNDGLASTMVPRNPTANPTCATRLLTAPRSTKLRTAVNNGMVEATSEATPAGTRLTPNTSNPLETVVMLNPTTKMLARSWRPRGTRSPRRYATTIRKVPPSTVRILASRNGVV